MSEWTARHDDSKIPQRVGSAQVVSLGSGGSSAKSLVTEARKSERVLIRRPHFEYVPQRGNYIDRSNEVNSRVVSGCDRRVAPIVSTFWTNGHATLIALGCSSTANSFYYYQVMVNNTQA